MKQSPTFIETLSLIRSDLLAMVFDRGKGRMAYLVSGVVKILLFPRIRVVIYYRLSHWAICHGIAPLAFYLQQRGLKCGGAEIHPAARIGAGFCLFHSNGLVIGDQVVIGPNFKCFHGVTLGDAGEAPGQPKVGEGVTIYAGAKVVGPITIGDHATIGANAVVLINVPAYRTAVGIPARVVPARV